MDSAARLGRQVSRPGVGRVRPDHLPRQHEPAGRRRCWSASTPALAYVDAFAAAFGAAGITRRNIELALATFERSIVSGRAPFDRWVEGDDAAISAAAKRGFDLFNDKAHCSGCHNGFSFTDGSFHDIGTAKDTDIGRGRLFPNSVKLRYAFKTPTLRDVTRRAPYMHDGSIATLEEVIDLYDRGGIERPSRSVLIRPLGLTDAERADLIAFLDTLTAPPKTASAAALRRQADRRREAEALARSGNERQRRPEQRQASDHQRSGAALQHRDMTGIALRHGGERAAGHHCCEADEGDH